VADGQFSPLEHWTKSNYRRILMLQTPPGSGSNLRYRFNFSGGPGALPAEVLEKTALAIDEVPGMGLSVLGLSHRTEWFREVVAEAEQHIRSLLTLPNHYHVLFLQGGSTMQFSQIPITFLRGRTEPADYLHTGYWSAKSITEAQKEGPVRVCWSGKETGFDRLPTDVEIGASETATYFHYVSNETVEGLQFHRTPGHAGVLRICDMSSDFLCRPLKVEEFSLIYAHAQKNLGPAGVTVVILREDLLKATPDGLPAMLDYRQHAEAQSIYNTPPVFAIYVTMLVLRWLKETIGGLSAMEALNREKARRLYSAMDGSGGFYRGHAEEGDRSLMNVVFHLATREQELQFQTEAEAAGLCGLEGHRSMRGGLRASIYNAVTLEAVDVLTTFMRDFQQSRG
jgi:phosphoserine aminotransferase